MKQEHLEGLALQLVRMRRTVNGLLTMLNALSPAIEIAIQQLELSPEVKVTTLATRFRERFNQFNLSAASKLLWLRHKLPFIIYDSRAVNALRDLGGTFENANYSEYCDCWRAQYHQREEAIKEAAARLHEVRTFLPPWHRTEAELRALVSEPWFRERVFDIYLWEMGGEG